MNAINKTPHAKTLIEYYFMANECWSLDDVQRRNDVLTIPSIVWKYIDHD